MIFKKGGMWKHSLSAQKFKTRAEAEEDWNRLAAPVEVQCEICGGEVCQCDLSEVYDLSPLEELWKSAEATSSQTE